MKGRVTGQSPEVCLQPSWFSFFLKRSRVDFILGSATISPSCVTGWGRNLPEPWAPHVRS